MRSAAENGFHGEVIEEDMGDDAAGLDIDQEVLDSVTRREQVAIQQRRVWQRVACGAIAVALGLVVVVIMMVNQQKVQYVQVSEGADGKVQLMRWTDRPWTVSEATVRDKVTQWLTRCRKFGTDESDVSWNRLRCWQQARKPAQRWVKAWFDALPVADVGKVGIRVAQPPLPTMRLVPPVAGRTWEVFWEEEWSAARNPLPQRKVFIALITVEVKSPEDDAQADFMGVWIENISLEERPVEANPARQ